MPRSPKEAYCTTREAARRLEVSVKTTQAWVESGALEAWKTPGGHRRITRASVDQLLVNRRDSSQAQPLRIDRELPYRILVVEDDEDLARLYEITIKTWGLPIEVIVAVDGFAALVEIGKRKPHLLITDLRMPGMDGFRLISALRADPYSQSVRVLVVSLLTASDIRAAGGLPADVLTFSKPVPFNELRRVVERELARSATRSVSQLR